MKSTKYGSELRLSCHFGLVRRASGREEGDICCGGHPHIPRQGLRPCNPFPGFRRSDILACGRPSLVRYYAHTEQVSLDLTLTQERGQTHDLRVMGVVIVVHRTGGRHPHTIDARIIGCRPVSSGIKRERIPPPQTTWIRGPSLEYASDVGRWRGLRIGDRRPLRERPDGVHQPANRILIADCEHSANLLLSGRNGCAFFVDEEVDVLISSPDRLCSHSNV